MVSLFQRLKSNFWFLVYLPDEDIMETDMTIEDGMKLIVSGGILALSKLNSLKVG